MYHCASCVNEKVMLKRCGAVVKVVCSDLMQAGFLQASECLQASSGFLQGYSALWVPGCHRCLCTHVPDRRHWLHHHRLWLLGFWGETEARHFVTNGKIQKWKRKLQRDQNDNIWPKSSVLEMRLLTSVRCLPGYIKTNPKHLPHSWNWIGRLTAFVCPLYASLFLTLISTCNNSLIFSLLSWCPKVCK